MYKFFAGIAALFNMWLCFFHWVTDKDVPSMIIEAMFGIVFAFVFLFVLIEEEDDDGDDYYVQNQSRAQT